MNLSDDDLVLQHEEGELLIFLSRRLKLYQSGDDRKQENTSDEHHICTAFYCFATCSLPG